MHLIKINSKNLGIVYININDIALFTYHKSSDCTKIYLRNEMTISIDNDVSAKIAKLIMAATNNSLLHLE